MVGVLAVIIGAGLATAVVTPWRSAPGPPRVEPEMPLTAMDRGLAPANNSPAVIADPTEPRLVVAVNRLDAPTFGCALQVSGDGGQGWVTAQPVPILPEGAHSCYGPEAAFDRAGVLHYLFIGLTGPGNEPMGVFMTTSADRSRTWSTPRQVLGPRNFGVRMAIDRSTGEQGRMHLAWLHATSDPPLGGYGLPPNPILAAHSDDGGRTFSAPLQVNDADRQRVVAPSLALGPNSGVHVAYYDLGADVRDYQGLEGPTWDGTWAVVVASSDDGGKNFGPGSVVDAEIVPPGRPLLIYTMPPPALVDDRRGRLCAAWTDGRHGDADALFRCNDGTRWSPPRRLNDDKVGNGRSQLLPQLAVSPNGRLDAIFYDRRDDPENVRNHVYYTWSADGGRSFAPSIRLSGHPSDSRIGQRYTNVSAEGQFEFGGRLGLLSQPSRALAAWADTRNSVPGETAQDLFAAWVDVGTSRQASGAVRSAGVALGVLGLAGIATAFTARRRQVAA